MSIPIPPAVPLGFTVRTLAQAIGFSKQYVLDDIHDGHLVASRPSAGRKWSIKPDEAARYAEWVTDGRPERKPRAA